MPTEPVIVILRPNGPLKVRGPVTVRRADGEGLARSNDLALCRCGHSGTKPFCDGTHKLVPFDSSSG